MSASTWKRTHNWLPLVYMIFSLLLILWLSLASKRDNRERINLETRITAEQLKIRLESCFNARAGIVKTLAGYPWQSSDSVVGAWTDRASSLLPLYDGVQALNYVGADGVIRVIHPVATNLPALNADLRTNANPSVVSALAAAEATGKMTRTNIVELLQSGKGFALYQQIIAADGQPAGFVNGVFRVDALMNSCIPEGRLLDHFSFALSDNGAVFYEQADDSTASDYAVDLQIGVTGEPWQFTFAPLTSYLEATDSIVDEVWIGLGLLLTVLLTLATRGVLIKQSEIKENQDKYRLLVENQTDMVVKVNPQGDFQYISPSYCEVFGKSEEELLNHQFMPLVHEEDRELTARSLESLQQPPHTSYHEQRAMTKEGWRWLAWSNTAILDDDGNIEAITAVGRDVTDVKRLEAGIAHSQKMRAIGELAGGITHDFNNLLQVIIGNIEYLLMDDKYDDATRESLAQMRNIAGRAVSLTAKLATLSRQEVTRPKVFPVNGFVRELKQLLAHTMPASVEMSLTLANEPLKIFGDKSQLEQVLLNLCFNARDAIDSSGHIRLQTRKRTLDRNAIASSPQLEPGDYVVITVEDDGRGIALDVLPRIFDPFFTTKDSGTGTGLGLANCYTIVEEHNGMITVDSTPGSGTCFSVFLPLAAGDSGPEIRSAESPGNEMQAGQLVLVADDNRQLLTLTCKVLEKAGFETCTAVDGEQALAMFKARKDKIRLVVMDLVMPEMSGQEVAEQMRELSSDVRILFVSGYVPERIRKTLKEPVIKKPYTIDELMAAVRGLL